MSMTVRKRRDNSTPHVLIHKVADVRGGVSVATSELGGRYLAEGAILSVPDSNGICHVIKTAQITSAVSASATKIKINKFHNFKVGDFVMVGSGKVADAITAIDESNKKYDEITVAAAIGAIEVGGFIVEAAAKNTTGTLKYTPQSINGSGKEFESTSNLNTDAWVIGVVKNASVPTELIEAMKGIITL